MSPLLMRRSLDFIKIKIKLKDRNIQTLIQQKTNNLLYKMNDQSWESYTYILFTLIGLVVAVIPFPSM